MLSDETDFYCVKRMLFLSVISERTKDCDLTEADFSSIGERVFSLSSLGG